MNGPLPQDPALPQLAQALDAAAMAAAFGNALHGVQVLGCAVDRVKYRPGRNCSVSYRLSLQDAQSGHCFEQTVAARFCSGGDSVRRHLQARNRSWVASAAGPALLHHPALDMLAFWLPNDPKLAALRLLHDDEALRSRCLDEVATALAGPGARLIDHHTTPVQVVPELRACARVVLRLQREPGAAITTHTLYAKTDIERSGATTHTVMQALHRSAAQAAGRLHTPQPLLWQEAAAVHWQLAVPGQALQDVDPQLGPASSALVGRQLAALHTTPVPEASRIDAAALRTQQAAAAELLARVGPSWRPRLTRLASRLAAGAAGLDGEAISTLHGDLHPRNILVDGALHRAQHAFIDLDSVRRGPAVIDLGAWVADSFYRAVIEGIEPRRAYPSLQHFLQAYADTAGRDADASLLAWSTAHHLLCQRAVRCVANLKPGRFAAVPILLALAEAIAAAGHIDAAAAHPLEAA
jgi:aminoglycoside phosphotransferase (APT) family kinase protein